MANYNNLKATINANIKANGNEEITGPILNTVLNQAVTTLGAGYQYMGVATPATSPGTPDANVFYIAATPGTYTNFGGKVVADGEVAILKYNGSWAKEVTGAATAAQVTQLGQKVDLKIDGITTIDKGLIWSNGYVNGSTGTVTASSTSQFSQPVLLKAGEKLSYKTGAAYTKAVVKVADSSPVAVGDTLSGDTIINYGTANVTVEYTATEDIYIVITVQISSNEITFTEYNSNSIQSQINVIGQDVVKKKGYGNGNLLDPDKFTEGYAIFASSGNISGGRTGFLITDYIPVNGKDIISNALFNSTWGGAVYDSSKSLLRPLTTSQYTYTSGDAYIRLTFQTSNAYKKAFYGTLLKPFSEFDPIAEYFEKDSASILNAVTPLDVLPIWASGYMVNPNNGNLAVDQYSYYTDYIKVSPGKRVKTNIVIGGNRGVAFYDGSGGYVSGINTYAKGEFSVPAGAYYMRMSTTNSSYNAGVFVRICGWIDEAIDKHTDSINALEKVVSQLDLVTDWIQGKMIGLSNGREVDDAGSYCTDFIQTEEGKTYATNVVIGGNRSIGFYNSSKVFISGINYLTNGQFTTPAGTAYMRVSTTSSSYTAGVYIREIGWISNGIAKNAEDISNIQEVLASVKIATSWEEGKFINYSTGYIDSSSSYALSDYVKVTAGKSYRTNIRFNGNAGACFYNANKIKVGGVNAFDEVVVENGVTLHSIISIPDGVSYIRSSHYLSSGIATSAIFFQEVDGIDYNCSDNKEASIVALDMMRDVIVQSVEANPYKLVSTDKSYIAFTFDDGEASNSDMVDLFHQKGVPLCLAIPRQRLKTMCLNGKTIAENCLAVEADGGEILTHSLTYMDANSTEDDIRAFFEWNKAGLLAAGLHPWGVVNAGGGAELGSVPNLEWLKRYAYSTHEYGLFFTALTDNVHFNFVRHGLGSRLSILKDYVDEQIAQHNPIIFNAHAPYDVDPDNLDGGWVQKMSDLLDYITTNYTSSDFEFCNIKTWMRKHQKTAAQLYFDSL